MFLISINDFDNGYQTNQSIFSIFDNANAHDIFCEYEDIVMRYTIGRVNKKLFQNSMRHCPNRKPDITQYRKRKGRIDLIP